DGGVLDDLPGQHGAAGGRLLAGSAGVREGSGTATGQQRQQAASRQARPHGPTASQVVSEVAQSHGASRGRITFWKSYRPGKRRDCNQQRQWTGDAKGGNGNSVDCPKGANYLLCRVGVQA